MGFHKIYERYQCRSDKIAFLKRLLSSSESPVGDWKVIKIYEARMAYEDDPYDFEELIKNRQLVRDEINRLQALPDDEIIE